MDDDLIKQLENQIRLYRQSTGAERVIELRKLGEILREIHETKNPTLIEQAHRLLPEIPNHHTIVPPVTRAHLHSQMRVRKAILELLKPPSERDLSTATLMNTIRELATIKHIRLLKRTLALQNGLPRPVRAFLVDLLAELRLDAQVSPTAPEMRRAAFPGVPLPDSTGKNVAPREKQ